MADVLEKEQKLLQTLMMEMIAFDTGDPKRINHFIKVHSLARTIALAENANTKAQIYHRSSCSRSRHRNFTCRTQVRSLR